VFEFSTNEAVLCQLALNPNTPGIILDTLALNGSSVLKGLVAVSGKHVKKKTILRLREDEELLVRNLASLVHWNEN
jgi:hypothetical protein